MKIEQPAPKKETFSERWAKNKKKIGEQNRQKWQQRQQNIEEHKLKLEEQRLKIEKQKQTLDATKYGTGEAPKPQIGQRKPGRKQALIGLGFLLVIIVIIAAIASALMGGSGSGSEGKLRIVMNNDTPVDITVKVVVNMELVGTYTIKANDMDWVDVDAKDSKVTAAFKLNSVGDWSSSQSVPGTWGQKGYTSLTLDFTSDLKVTYQNTT